MPRKSKGIEVLLPGSSHGRRKKVGTSMMKQKGAKTKQTSGSRRITMLIAVLVFIMMLINASIIVYLMQRKMAKTPTSNEAAAAAANGAPEESDEANQSYKAHLRGSAQAGVANAVIKSQIHASIKQQQAKVNVSHPRILHGVHMH